jgi:hypothetical protein
MKLNYVEGQGIKILECLQSNNATTDYNLEENGLTPTDLAGFGLNKTQVLKNILLLKTKQLVIGKKIWKTTRPGNYYVITTLGTLLLFKLNLENTIELERENILEKIKEHYPLIKNHWDDDLLDFTNLRYTSLENAINNIDIQSRDTHYISLSITFPSERNFITFEKNYFLVTTEETGHDKIRNGIESKDVKRFTIDELEKDLKNMVSFLFYYHLSYELKKSLKLIKKSKEGVARKAMDVKKYNQEIVSQAIRLNRDFGYDLKINKLETLEKEITKKLNYHIDSVESIIKKDKQIHAITVKHRSELRDIANSALSLI